MTGLTKAGHFAFVFRTTYKEAKKNGLIKNDFWNTEHINIWLILNLQAKEGHKKNLTKMQMYL